MKNSPLLFATSLVINGPKYDQKITRIKLYSGKIIVEKQLPVKSFLPKSPSKLVDEDFEKLEEIDIKDIKKITVSSSFWDLPALNIYLKNGASVIVSGYSDELLNLITYLRSPIYKDILIINNLSDLNGLKKQKNIEALIFALLCLSVLIGIFFGFFVLTN